MDLKTLRTYFIATLMAATPLNAEEDDSPVLRASPEVQAQLSPIADIFLATAGRDVIVLAQEDLVTDNPMLQRQMRMAQSIGTPPTALFTEDDSLEIIRVIKEQYQIGPLYKNDQLSANWEAQFQDFKDIQLFSNIFSNQASARHVPIINEKEEDCLITSPSLSGQAGRILSMFGHLPNEQYPLINNAITYDDIYQFVMFHEAAHCDQEHPNDALSGANNLTPLELAISGDLLRLDMETEADTIALQQMRVLLERQGRPIELAEEIGNATRAARSIGALRMGADIFDGAEFYPKHATHVFDEQPDFDYTGADVFLAIKITTTLVNTTMGYLHGGIAQQSLNPSLSDTINGDDPYPPLILAPQEAASAGLIIGHELPEVQYGTIRAMLEISENFPKMDSLSGDEYDYLRTSLEISRQIMHNHVDAVQTYYPTIANSVLAQDSYDQLMTLGNAAIEAATNYDPDTAKVTPEEPRDYSSLPPYMQNMIARFEAGLTTPTNAMETLVLIRQVVSFYEDFEMMLELEFEREMREFESPALPPGKTGPILSPFD